VTIVAESSFDGAVTEGRPDHEGESKVTDADMTCDPAE